MLKQFLSLFLQAKCPLCDRPAMDILCRDCDRQVKQCQFSNPKLFWEPQQPLFIWGQYQDHLKQAIAAMKYNNQPELGTWMGQQLGQIWRQSFPDQIKSKLTVIPIPLHAEKQKIRGFNQAEKIANGFCQVTGFRQVPQGLIRIKNTEALFSLNVEQRQRELQQAFCLDLTQVKARSPVILIDDIYTTGTTINEALQLLRKHQISIQGIAAIATTKPMKKQRIIPTKIHRK